MSAPGTRSAGSVKLKRIVEVERPVFIISDERHGSIAEERAVLEPLGIELRVANCHSAQDIVAACAEADAVLLNLAPMDATAIAGLKRCKVISRYGIGMDNVDIPAATARGIVVRNVPGYCNTEVADHALALLLALLRGISERNSAIRAGSWNITSPQRSLSGGVIGVAGFGGSGRAFAKRALALQPATLLVWSPHCTQKLLESELGQAAAAFGATLRSVSFDELLASSDALSIHLKLCADTKALFSRRSFSLMKNGSFLVNCSRGGIVDSAELAIALDDGRIAGAGLDVLDQEPPQPGHPLLGHPKVIMSDHCAYRSDRSISELKHRCAFNAAQELGLL
jgi:D-3-phosphoglycerate dehydrogenase